MGNSISRSRRLLALAGVVSLSAATAGCVVDAPPPPGGSLDNAEINSIEQSLGDVAAESEDIDCDDVTVTVVQTGTNEYTITAEAIIYASVWDIWPTIRDFEQLVEIGLPGLATNFQWLSGGPSQVPSTFQFVTGGETVVEEIYYRSDYNTELSYQVLEPALGIIEYDATIDVDPVYYYWTAYTATREVTLEPGAVDGLVDLIELETENIKDYFEANSATQGADADSAAE